MLGLVAQQAVADHHGALEHLALEYAVLEHLEGHLLAELSFASREALDAGLGSAEGRAAAADVTNFADGGATMFVARD